MTISSAVVIAFLSIFGGAGASLIAGWLARPKTRAEADQVQTAAEVSVSQEAREWARDFGARADRAEQRAEHAEQRADDAEERVDELEAVLIECYGYVRSLREVIRQSGKTPPPLPLRLEALWRATGH